MTVDDLTDHLRHRVLGLLHVDRVQPGGKLASIRQVASQLEVDHRAVAEAYRRLQEEGLVEVRPASGVYVAGTESVDEGVASSTTAWVTDFLLQGWKKRTGRAAVADLLDRAARTRWRCACLESVRDHMVALTSELEGDFDLDVDPVYLDGQSDEEVARRLREADLVVALQFHGAEARRWSSAAGRPVVLASVSKELTQHVALHLAAGPITVVVEDERMFQRVASYFGVTAHHERVHPVLAADLGSLEEAERFGRPVLATLAARRVLGADEFHLVRDAPSFLSTESARALLTVLTRMAIH